MSSTKDWGGDLHNMLKSTEKNISSIKSRLDSNSNAHVKPTNHASRYRTPEKDRVKFFSAQDRSTHHVTLEKDREKISPLQSTRFRHVSPHVQSPESSLVMSLYKRVEEQSKTISHLSETVQVQSTEIQQLKDVQNDFENQLKGRTGLTFDRKLESVQRELRSEIESLRTMMNSHSFVKPNESSIDSVYHLTRDAKSQRRLIEDETDSVRREVDSLKNRIMKIETDVHTSLRDTHEVSRKFTNVQRDVSTVTDHQRQLRRVADRKEQELHFINQQLQEISDVVTDMSHSTPSVKKNKLPRSFHKQRVSAVKDEDLLNDKDAYRSTKMTSLNYLDDSPLNSLLSYSSELDLSIESLTTLGGDVKDNLSDDYILSGKYSLSGKHSLSGKDSLTGKHSLIDHDLISGKSYVNSNKSKSMLDNDLDLFGNDELDPGDDLTTTDTKNAELDLFGDEHEFSLENDRHDLLLDDDKHEFSLDDNHEFSLDDKHDFSLEDDNNDILSDIIFKSSMNSKR